jgi:hypothetical protein
MSQFPKNDCSLAATRCSSVTSFAPSLVKWQPSSTSFKETKVTIPGSNKIKMWGESRILVYHCVCIAADWKDSTSFHRMMFVQSP